MLLVRKLRSGLNLGFFQSGAEQPNVMVLE